MDVMTFLFYSESTEGNSQRAGQYGLSDGKCEGHSGAESDRIRSEGEALKDRRMKSPIEDRWEHQLFTGELGSSILRVSKPAR